MNALLTQWTQWLSSGADGTSQFRKAIRDAAYTTYMYNVEILQTWSTWRSIYITPYIWSLNLLILILSNTECCKQWSDKWHHSVLQTCVSLMSGIWDSGSTVLQGLNSLFCLGTRHKDRCSSVLWIWESNCVNCGPKKESIVKAAEREMSDMYNLQCRNSRNEVVSVINQSCSWLCLGWSVTVKKLLHPS